jgi:hypothetical protein
MLHERIDPRVKGGVCIVAATGPSLTDDVVRQCAGHTVFPVNDAHRLFPQAPFMYACDNAWWKVHDGAPKFKGEKWSSHGDERSNNKLPAAEKYGLHLVHGRRGKGFALEGTHIHYAGNSGFQTINLALLFGHDVIIMVGFDMKQGLKNHFFGNHPRGLSNHNPYTAWIGRYNIAAKMLPKHIKVINCTPGSGLKCFPLMPLSEALKHHADHATIAGHAA